MSMSSHFNRAATPRAQRRRSPRNDIELDTIYFFQLNCVALCCHAAIAGGAALVAGVAVLTTGNTASELSLPPSLPPSPSLSLSLSPYPSHPPSRPEPALQRR